MTNPNHRNPPRIQTSWLLRQRYGGLINALSFRLCQAIKRALAVDDMRTCWSQRARTQLEEERRQSSWITPGPSSVVVAHGDEVTWWTFAGRKANATLATAFTAMTQIPASDGNLTIEFHRPPPPGVLEQALEQLRSCYAATLLPKVTEEALEALKFSECLPPALALHLLRARRHDREALTHVLATPVRRIS